MAKANVRALDSRSRLQERRVVVIVGIAGVGKSTLTKRAISILEEKGIGHADVNFGSVMFEEARKIHGLSHRDDIRKLPVVEQRKLQVSAARTISKMSSDVLFVDTHLFIRTKEGLWPGLPNDVLRALSPTNMVLVEASPIEIMERRSEDKTRYRDEVTQESLEREIFAARSMLFSSAVLTGSPVALIRNEQGKADKAVEELLNVVLAGW